MKTVLIVGSAPDAARIQSIDCSTITYKVAINNAWRLRKDWDYVIYPEDFPKEKQPTSFDKDKLISAKQYVPKQNSLVDLFMQVGPWRLPQAIGRLVH